MDSAAELRNLLIAVIADLRDWRVVWQVTVVAVALGLAWWIDRRVAARFAAGSNAAAGRIGIGGLRRIAFPLAALVFVMTGRGLLRNSHAVHLLDLAVPLLFSLLVVRLAVYMLRLIFTGSWVSTFERFIAWTVWIWFALYVSGFAHRITQHLDDLAFHVGKHKISALLIGQGVLSIGVTLLVALWIGRILEARLMGADSLDINLRVVLTKIVRAGLIVLAVLIALPAVGIDLTLLSVFGGAVGVGLGFGLQKIASNYVSGFIILLDRSLSIGDIVTVDNRSGQLTRMTARYVVVRSADGTEAIIPNESIIASTVVNHTHSDPKVRVGVPVQVAYGTDLDLATGLMKEAAAAHERVIAEPPPNVLLTTFADSGINLELGVWIADPQNGTGNLRSDLNFAIWRAFRAHGVEIPFPQREVRLIPPSAA
jgi:small-conductance mechanosensitive channel